MPGTSVWVCEPQSVRIALTYFGVSGSLMSKILTPSQRAPGAAGTEFEETLLQESSVRCESVPRNSRFP